MPELAPAQVLSLRATGRLRGDLDVDLALTERWTEWIVQFLESCHEGVLRSVVHLRCGVHEDLLEEEETERRNERVKDSRKGKQKTQGLKKLETHIVRDIIVRCTCTLFPCCALSE